MRERWWCEECGEWLEDDITCVCGARPQRLTGSALWEVEEMERILGTRVTMKIAETALEIWHGGTK